MLEFYLSLLDTDDEKSKFEKLYIRYRPRLKYTARIYLTQDADVDDAVEETFLKLTECLHKIEIIESKATERYLIIMVENLCKNILRDRARQGTVEFEQAPEEALWTKVDFDAFEVDEIFEKVLCMSEKQKSVLELKFHYLLSNKEISEELNIPRPLVRKRIQRARFELRQLLSEVVEQ